MTAPDLAAVQQRLTDLAGWTSDPAVHEPDLVAERAEIEQDLHLRGMTR